MIGATPSLDQFNEQQLREPVSRLMGEMRIRQATIDKLTREMAVLKRLKFAAASEAYTRERQWLLFESFKSAVRERARYVRSKASYEFETYFG